MARKKKVTTETVKQDALELLALTLQGTKARFVEAAKDEYPVEAALISASVALLKLVDAKTSLGDDDREASLETQRREFEASRKARAAAHVVNSAESITDLYVQD